MRRNRLLPPAHGDMAADFSSWIEPLVSGARSSGGRARDFNALGAKNCQKSRSRLRYFPIILTLQVWFTASDDARLIAGIERSIALFPVFIKQLSPFNRRAASGERVWPGATASSRGRA